jgi:hypothetical protein
MSCMVPLRPMRRRCQAMLAPERLAAAILSSLDGWCSAVEEIEQHATPGNKVRALNLLKSMRQAKISLEHLAQDTDE